MLWLVIHAKRVLSDSWTVEESWTHETEGGAKLTIKMVEVGRVHHYTHQDAVSRGGETSIVEELSQARSVSRSWNKRVQALENYELSVPVIAVEITQRGMFIIGGPLVWVSQDGGRDLYYDKRW